MCFSAEDFCFSVSDAIRGWVGFDGPMLQWLALEGDDAPGVTALLSRILERYGVRRGIPDRLVSRALGAVAQIHDLPFATLFERAVHVSAAVCALQQAGQDRHRLVSGMTKLLWFASPARWTLFDKWAALAVGAQGRDPVERMLEFYATLDALDFLDVAAAIGRRLQDHDFAGVHGERVLDKYLMLLGKAASAGNEHRQAERRIRVWHQALPEAFRTRLDGLTQDLLNDPQCHLEVGCP